MASTLHLGGLRKWFLQTPPVEWAMQNVRELLLAALRQGPVPQHVAFVMDGNRRFARKHHVEAIEGHNLGFEALARCLEVCYKSGVRVVTVYAFSIENFKRSKFEVNALMDMAKVKLTEMGAHGALLDRYGAKIQFLGNKHMIRPDVLESIDKAIEMTSHNTRAILNICAPYTSRDEMTVAIRETVVSYSKPVTPLKRPFSQTHIARNIRNQQLTTVSEESNGTASKGDASKLAPPPLALNIESSPETSPNRSGTDVESQETSPTTAPSDRHSPNYPDPENITADTLNSHTFTANMPPLDLLVRTSGVERLSDFMLWQCHQNTEVVFVDCLWPEFDLWKFLPILVEWQWRKQKGEDGEPSRGRRKHVKQMMTGTDSDLGLSPETAAVAKVA